MYAIVEIAGQQFKVQKDQKLYVHHLEGKEGDKVQFDNVMLIDNGGKVNIGAPAIDGAAVSAKILQHLKGDKVVVFKKKRRKGYKVKNGHRQHLTQVEIEKIIESGAKKAAKPKKEAAPKAEAKPKAEKKEAAPKAEAPKKEDAPSSTEVKAKVEKAEEAPKAEAAATDLSKMTVAELKAMAKEKGLTGYSSMKKDELIAALS